MKAVRRWPVSLAVYTLFAVGAFGGSVWERATEIYGNKADRYLYLALPLETESGEKLFPLRDDGRSYYVGSAAYTVSVKNGESRGSFDIRFSVRKRTIALRGVKNNLIVDLGDKRVVDISYIVTSEKGRWEYHNYFKTVPKEFSVRLFPGFLGSDLFGRVAMDKREAFENLVGVEVKSAEGSYRWFDPSPFSDMQAGVYTEGESALLSQTTLLDGVADRWRFVSDLEIWNIFHYGLKKPKNRTFTGFLNIRFHVKPIAGKMDFGNVSLPFSEVGYEVRYKLSSEYAKARLIASDNTLIPRRSHFLYKKMLDHERIDLKIDIEIHTIAFEAYGAL